MDDLTISETTDEQADGPELASPKKRIGTGRILIGVGALIVHNKNQDNQQAVAQAKAAAAANPKAQTAGVRSDGSHYGPLFAYLLPVPSGYVLGPDDADYGNNTTVSAPQVNRDIDGLLPGQPQADLSSAASALAQLSLKGVAVRTYADDSTSLVVEIVLIQANASDGAGNDDTLKSTIADPNTFSLGPEVPGYPDAECMLPPGLGSGTGNTGDTGSTGDTGDTLDTSDTFDSVICMASSGDVEVRVNAYGAAPLDMTSITQLVSRQLDLLKTNQTIG